MWNSSITLSAILFALAFTAVGLVIADEPKKAPTPQPSPASIATWNFDSDKPGEPAPGWRIAATHPGKSLATWHVTKDAAAPSGPNVLTIKKTESTGGTFNLAIAEKSAFTNVDLSVKLRPNSGKEDQGGGLIWRCTDEYNYYICRMNPLESNYRVYKVVNGKRTQLEGATAKTTAGTWYTVRAVMIGDRITCYLDGKKMLEARDDTFKTGGMIGLWTKADAASSFDDVTAHESSIKPSGSDDAKKDLKPSGKKKGGGDDDDDD